MRNDQHVQNVCDDYEVITDLIKNSARLYTSNDYGFFYLKAK